MTLQVSGGARVEASQQTRLISIPARGRRTGIAVHLQQAADAGWRVPLERNRYWSTPSTMPC